MAKLYGRGSIEELVKGAKYRITLSAGKDPVTGKYRKRKETFLGTKRQAELRVEQIRRELESGRAIDADKIKFCEWLESYLSNRESMGKQRPATLKRDRVLSKHLLRGFGNALVVEITPAMVNSFYASLRDSGVGDTTIKQCHRLLKSVMKQAVNNDIILRNPVERADVPKNPVPKRQCLEVSDVLKLNDICTSGTPTANKMAVYIALATGARLGEVLGLTWGNTDLYSERPYIYFIQQYTGANKLAPLKTDKDDNPVGGFVPIDGSTVAVLRSWKSVQRNQLNVLGIEQGNDTPIITNQLGAFTNHSRFERWWRSFCVENGYGRLVTPDGKQIKELVIGDDASLFPDCVIEWRDADGWPCDKNGKRYSRTYKRPMVKKYYDGLHFHALRHTHFTLRGASGTDLATMQYLGRWSSPAMLLNVYMHPVTENIWKSAGFMDGLSAREKALKGGV